MYFGIRTAGDPAALIPGIRAAMRELDAELPLDAVGTVRGLPDSNFRTPRELGERLAREPACQKCIVKQLFRYANGRSEEPEDQPAIEQAYERFRRSQFRFRELIIAIAISGG